jgi:CRISPR-associated protein Csh1
LGPIIKRTFTNKSAGPSKRIQDTTLKAFSAIGSSNAVWADYFRDAHECFSRKKLYSAVEDKIFEAKDGAFTKAIEVIEERRTVLLCYETANGELPGDSPSYQAYLMKILAESKYTTGKASEVPNQRCSLCGQIATLLPNGIKGAGINFANVDREGAFPSMDIEECWKHYSLCIACADLLYIFAFHFSDQFIASIAGEKAMVLPSLIGDPTEIRRFVRKFRGWLANLNQGQVKSRENELLRLLAESNSVAELIFLWADFGQRIDNVRGVVSDVLPSRLRELEIRNRELSKSTSAAFPDSLVDEARFDLSLNFLDVLFKRPGGRKAKRENESKRLFDLKRSLVAAIYRGERIDPVRFNEEWMKSARWYLMQLIEDHNWGNLCWEGINKKGESYLTFAGWIRHLAMLFNYLRKTGVLPMHGEIYQPQTDRLKPYFTEETAIDSNAKAYAFMLGVLYGKVMQVQAARGVNVGANALTWLKRLTLSGADLPDLYIKVREKLLAYETERNPDVRDIISELGELGTRTKSLSELCEVDTCYFLLLGQSLTGKILPTKKSEMVIESPVS